MTKSIPETSVTNTLPDHPFLCGLKCRHQQLLEEFSMPLKIAAGQEIFREGDIANRLYLIERGAVALENVSNGTTRRIQVIGPGDVLGWSWLFAPYQWHFRAVALVPTEAVFLYGTRLRAECEQDPEFGYEVMKRISQIVVDRLQATRKQLLRLTN